MRQHNISALVVVNETGDLVGVITRTDLVRACYQQPDWMTQSVRDYMNADVVTVFLDDPMSKVMGCSSSGTSTGSWRWSHTANDSSRWRCSLPPTSSTTWRTAAEIGIAADSVFCPCAPLTRRPAGAYNQPR